MALETLDDIVEALADRCGVWGGGTPNEYGDYEHPDDCTCRMCWILELKHRLRQAVVLEQTLERGRIC